MNSDHQEIQVTPFKNLWASFIQKQIRFKPQNLEEGRKVEEAKENIIKYFIIIMNLKMISSAGFEPVSVPAPAPAPAPASTPAPYQTFQKISLC